MRASWLHIAVFLLVAYFVYVHFFRGIPIKKK